MTNEKKTEKILIRVFPSTKTLCEKAAVDDNRTVSGLIDKLLTDYLREKGYLPSTSDNS